MSPRDKLLLSRDLGCCKTPKSLRNPQLVLQGTTFLQEAISEAFLHFGKMARC